MSQEKNKEVPKKAEISKDGKTIRIFPQNFDADDLANFVLNELDHIARTKARNNKEKKSSKE